MQITNNGDTAVAVPLDDGTTATLEPGASLDVRMGNADFAVRTFPGVEYATKPQPNGLAEASTEAAVGPIGDYVQAHPEDIRYAVVGDSPAVPGDVTVIGSDTPAIEGGITTSPVGTLPAVPGADGEPIPVTDPATGDRVEVQTAASAGAAPATDPGDIEPAPGQGDKVDTGRAGKASSK